MINLSSKMKFNKEMIKLFAINFLTFMLFPLDYFHSPQDKYLSPSVVDGSDSCCYGGGWSSNPRVRHGSIVNVYL